MEALKRLRKKVLKKALNKQKKTNKIYSVLKVRSRRSAGETNAPLAQLVEHLTLNQGVLGSSPRWCTMRWPVGQVAKTAASHAANRSSTLLPVTN